jgi:hypothetical protein
MMQECMARIAKQVLSLEHRLETLLGDFVLLSALPFLTWLSR